MQLHVFILATILGVAGGRHAVSHGQQSGLEARDCAEASTATEIRTLLAAAVDGDTLDICISERAPTCVSWPACL